MIPHTLTISGFLSYREKTTIDFRQFNIACISGNNGAGKSSILDAITWVIFDKARERGDEVINTHISVEKAEVTLIFSYENNIFKIYRTREKNKSGSVEFLIAADPKLAEENSEDVEWNVLTERTASATNDRIEKQLRMDYKTFINTAFFLQGKADQFTKETPGSRKEILSSILGLDKYAEYKKIISTKAKLTKSEQDKIIGKMQQIDSELEEEDARELAYSTLQERHKSNSKLLHEMELNIELIRKSTNQKTNLENELGIYKEQITDSEKQLIELNRNLDKYESDKANLETLLEERDSIEKRYEQNKLITKALNKFEETFREHSNLNIQRLAEKEAINLERTGLTQNLKHLLATEDKLPGIRTNHQAVLKNKEELDSEIDDLTKHTNLYQILQEKRDSINQEHTESKALHDQITQELEDVNIRLATLQKSTKPECPICKEELSEENKLLLLDEWEYNIHKLREGLQANVQKKNELSQSLTQIKHQLDEVTRSNNLLITKKEKLANILAQIDNLNNELTNYEENISPNISTLREQIETGDYAHQNQQDLAILENKLLNLSYDEDEHENLRQQARNLTGIEDQYTELTNAVIRLNSVTDSIEQYNGQIKSQETAINQLMEVIRNKEEQLFEYIDLEDLNEVQGRLAVTRIEHAKLQKELGAAEQRVSILETQKQTKRKLQIEQNDLAILLGRYRQLEQAFGVHGIPGMLMESAIPQLESHANDLLDKLSGGTLSVRFQTQKEYKDKKREDKQETLEIIISDNVSQRSFETFSGGESFRVMFAIRLALSELLAKRAGARLQTLVIDEGFGTQDPLGRKLLIEAINMIKDNYEMILVITHISELRDAFTTRIDVQKENDISRIEILM